MTLTHNISTTPANETLAVRVLQACDQAPGEARAWAAEVLGRWELPGLVDDVASTLTELVTNSVQAGPTGLTALIEWHKLARRVEIAVWDDAPGLPAVQEPDYVGERGRGLHMIAALAAEWGYHPGADAVGKVVWASLEVSGNTHDVPPEEIRAQFGCGTRAAGTHPKHTP